MPNFFVCIRNIIPTFAKLYVQYIIMHIMFFTEKRKENTYERRKENQY